MEWNVYISILQKNNNTATATRLRCSTATATATRLRCSTATATATRLRCSTATATATLRDFVAPPLRLRLRYATSLLHRDATTLTGLPVLWVELSGQMFGMRWTHLVLNSSCLRAFQQDRGVLDSRLRVNIAPFLRVVLPRTGGDDVLGLSYAFWFHQTGLVQRGGCCFAAAPLLLYSASNDFR
jgi:hypothetical protein